jgi:hypothetical protein
VSGSTFKFDYAYNGPVLWNLNLHDAQGNAISETYGNGLWLQNSFDPACDMTAPTLHAPCEISGFDENSFRRG